MPRWEYMVLDVNVGTFFIGPKLNGDALIGRLNELGADGWELINTSAMDASTGRTRDLVCFLKRPRK